MGCNTLALGRITRFLYKWGLFAHQCTDVEDLASHIILHMLNLTTKSYNVERGNRTHQYMLQHISLSTIRTIASMRLSSHALRCETECWGTSAKSGRYAYFALNKFESMSITLWYNALPLIIFDHAFHTSSTKPNPWTNFSRNTICTLDCKVYW